MPRKTKVLSHQLSKIDDGFMNFLRGRYHNVLDSCSNQRNSEAFPRHILEDNLYSLALGFQFHVKSQFNKRLVNVPPINQNQPTFNTRVPTNDFLDQSIAIQYQVVRSIKSNMICDDSYIQLGGAINDYGVLKMLKADYVSAESSFKNALYTINRAHSLHIDDRLRCSLTANIIELFARSRRINEALDLCTKFIPELNQVAQRNQNFLKAVILKSQGSSQLSEINDIASLNEDNVKLKTKGKKFDSTIQILLPTYHDAQHYFTIARVLGCFRSGEESIIFFNEAFKRVLDIPDVQENCRLLLAQGLIDLAIVKYIQENVLQQKLHFNHIKVDYLQQTMTNFEIHANFQSTVVELLQSAELILQDTNVEGFESDGSALQWIESIESINMSIDMKRSSRQFDKGTFSSLLYSHLNLTRGIVGHSLRSLDF